MSIGTSVFVFHLELGLVLVCFLRWEGLLLVFFFLWKTFPHVNLGKKHRCVNANEWWAEFHLASPPCVLYLCSQVQTPGPYSTKTRVLCIWWILRVCLWLLSVFLSLMLFICIILNSEYSSFNHFNAFC